MALSTHLCIFYQTELHVEFSWMTMTSSASTAPGTETSVQEAVVTFSILLFVFVSHSLAQQTLEVLNDYLQIKFN